MRLFRGTEPTGVPVVDLKDFFLVLGWVTSVVLFVIKFRADRKQPQRIVCREIDQTSLVRINKDALEHINVTFHNEPVGRLSQIVFDLFNIGAEAIKPATIRFTFDAKTEVLDYTAKIDPPQSEGYELKFSSDGNVVDLMIPYLNPRKHHAQHIILTFVCDGAVNDVKVSGGAEGWSVLHQEPGASRSRTLLEKLEPVSAIPMGVGVLATLIAVSPTFMHDGQISPAFVVLFTLVVVTLIQAVNSHFRNKETESQTWYDHGLGYTYRPKKRMSQIKYEIPVELLPNEFKQMIMEKFPSTPDTPES